MFTGIIESLGEVKETRKKGSMLRLRVKSLKSLGDIREGSSVSVNGACLTVLSFSNSKNSQIFNFEVSEETALRTNLNGFPSKSFVNLERAISLAGRLAGHLVLGHVDMMTRFLGSKEKSGGDWLFDFGFEKGMGEFFVEKGSVALNGISLTIFNVKEDRFSSSILPYTMENTNLRYLKRGDLVNCEADIIGKYVKKFMEAGSSKKNIDMAFLGRHGFLDRA